MKIAILSKADSAGGGASRVAEYLARKINESSSHKSIHINTWRSHDYSFTQHLWKKDYSLIRFIRKIENKLGVPDLFPVELFRTMKLLRKFKPDVIHFHDISSAFSPITISVLSRFYKTFWTFHDVSPVTGGCLYPGDCRSFVTGCGGCPQLGIWPITTTVDRTRYLSAYKTKVLNSGRVHLISPSEWMKDLVSKKINNVPTVISNGIETEKYQNLTANELLDGLKKLKFSADKLTICFTCSNSSDPRKGFDIALNVINELYLKIGDSFQVIILGILDDSSINKLPKIDTYIAGYVSDEDIKAELLQLADVYLYTSLEDNQPLAVLEALCAGLEVHGIATGGIPELENKFKNAIFLVDKKNVDSIAENISKSVSKNSNKFDIQKQAKRHLDLGKHVSQHIQKYNSELI